MSSSFDDKSEALQLLASENNPDTKEVLKLLGDGQLFYHKKEKQLFIIKNYDTGAEAINFDGQSQVISRKRDYKKVTLNNALRGVITQLTAEMELNATDPGVREVAVRDLMKDLSPSTVSLLKTRFTQEQNAGVKALIGTALAVNDLKSDDAATVAQAIERVDGSLEQEVRAALLNIVNDHPSEDLQQQAQKVINGIDNKIEYYGWLETLYFGLSLGSVLVLAGIGLAITFGVMGVINMAHGELIMIGAYTTYVIQQLMPNHIGMSVIIAIPAAFIVSGLVGIAIERGVIRFLYGRPLETLLATFGISLILQQAVRSIFSPLNRSVETPEWMSGLIQINPVFALTESRLYIILFCLIVFFALSLVLKKTPLGLQVRAVSQNRAMAQAMGVRSNRVDALTFGLGSGVAGVAGVALSQLTNVGPNLGQAYIIDSFMVVVFGGVGNLWGTLVAGLSLGVANKVLEPWAGAVLAKILVLVFIILFIQKRPRGLFPQRGRAAEG
ncbi:urea ABC transporter permease subunit UrtB [Neptunomonas phycophila]|uniref:urea ABC transporter permease subunit UrtB n=1 Tax=Neptunomonas phycophila TaxID=1572645 RepID=UPI0026E3E1C7|nr:urea ABC transporter permease subunit UrtB [Neptunomonas phycophila]MDO6784113.1 urea ABC transporter permease subunit UrtB [Neptunomonas phycophila]